MRIPAIVAIVGFFGLYAAAHAQSPAGGFDGTYRLVSSATVNASYTAKGGQSAGCPERAPSALVVAGGQASYTAASGRVVNGTVGPLGDLIMRSVVPGYSRPNELAVNGTINAAGTVHARQRGFSCSYDFVWQK
jgi:hypothetical protein